MTNRIRSIGIVAVATAALMFSAPAYADCETDPGGPVPVHPCLQEPCPPAELPTVVLVPVNPCLVAPCPPAVQPHHVSVHSKHRHHAR